MIQTDAYILSMECNITSKRTCFAQLGIMMEHRSQLDHLIVLSVFGMWHLAKRESLYNALEDIMAQLTKSLLIQTLHMAIFWPLEAPIRLFTSENYSSERMMNM